MKLNEGVKAGHLVARKGPDNKATRSSPYEKFKWFQFLSINTFLILKIGWKNSSITDILINSIIFTTHIKEIDYAIRN